MIRHEFSFFCKIERRVYVDYLRTALHVQRKNGLFGDFRFVDEDSQTQRMRTCIEIKFIL